MTLGSIPQLSFYLILLPSGLIMNSTIFIAPGSLVLFPICIVLIFFCLPTFFGVKMLFFSTDSTEDANVTDFIFGCFTFYKSKVLLSYVVAYLQIYANIVVPSCPCVHHSAYLFSSSSNQSRPNLGDCFLKGPTIFTLSPENTFPRSLQIPIILWFQCPWV